MSSKLIGRGEFLVSTGAAALAATLPTIAVAAPRTIKIGLVQPVTGPLALFAEDMPYAMKTFTQKFGGTLRNNGTAYPYEIIVRDSQSNPNRAAEVARDLISKEKVDLIISYATPETVNPVSDQCELNGMPCLTNDEPLEPYFFGRHGDPKKGFQWTYHYFFSADEQARAMIPFFTKVVKSDRVAGGLWGNDADGLAQSAVYVPKFKAAGYQVVDPGRFDMPASSYNAQIAAFKSGHAEVIEGVLPPPDFATFWNGAAQQGFRPKVVFIGKATEFPEPIYALGPKRGDGLSIEVWWSRFHPFFSKLTGLHSRELADGYESATKRQAAMSLGFRYSLLEVAFDALQRTQDLSKPASIRDAIKSTNYRSMVGTIDFSKGPFPNTCVTPLVIGQWHHGSRFPYELAIVDNSNATEIPTNATPRAIPYT